MSDERFLVAWIGHTDFACMSESLEDEQREELITDINWKGGRDPESRGPIRALVEERSFGEVHLLSTMKNVSWANAKYAEWLGCDPTIHELPDIRPTDYRQVYESARGVLEEIVEDGGAPEGGLAMHLSPGTPAMAAVWVLLGKSLFQATFYQTFRNNRTRQDEVTETEIPLSLYAEYLPRVLRDTSQTLRVLAEPSPEFEGLVGSSKAMGEVVARAQKVAPHHVPVLLLGESGTGKEVLARRIHEASGRQGTFHPVHCAAVAKGTLASELFGHTKGAYTGAQGARDGAFKRADSGTLFLDEIGECDHETQVMLLRVLQPLGDSPTECTYRPMGADEDEESDVRIIAATNKNMMDAIDKGEFREDLYYRLGVVTISIPPLRERRDDIVPLAKILLEEINRAFPDHEDREISTGAMAFLASSPWRGNVRQLKNALTQAVVMGDDVSIQKDDIAAALQDGFQGRIANPLGHGLGDGFSLDDLVTDVRRHYIERARDEGDGTLTKATELLGYRNYQTLRKQIDRFEIDW